jgi:ElaB/YqjD/DUF883 family membrane-anchored ribosome-binding protein
MGQAVPPIPEGPTEPESALNPGDTPGPVLVREPAMEKESGIEKTARALGSGLGRVVNRVRHLPERVQQIKQQWASKETWPGLEVQTAELAAQAKERGREIQGQAAAYSRQNPFVTLTLAAAGGLLAGLGLRLWRDRRG